MSQKMKLLLGIAAPDQETGRLVTRKLFKLL